MRGPATIAEALSAEPADALSGGASGGGSGSDEADATAVHHEGPLAVLGDGPLVVREKTHDAVPMTLDQALFEMELVGHDFYLFVDQATAQPSVVYRRKGYDYGVIRLSA